MTNETLLNAYKDARQFYPTAMMALSVAKMRPVVDYGFHSVLFWPWQKGAHNVTLQKAPHYCRDKYACIENTESAGLRFVGFADEIVKSINHKGWFTSEENWTGEIYRGAVWQLPGRKGVARFIAGYASPCNEGAAFVELDVISETPGQVRDYSYAPARLRMETQEEANDSAKRDAALRAEIFAEKEREYEALWEARTRFEAIPNEIAGLRSIVRQSIAELRQARKALDGLPLPLACKTLRNSIRSNLRGIEALREERAQLESDYSWHNEWKTIA